MTGSLHRLLFAGLLCAAPAFADGWQASLQRRLSELDALDARTANAALEALVELGEPAARAALDELLDERPEDGQGRKWRARLVARAGEAANLSAALEGLADSDPAVRLELCTFVARPGLTERLVERVAALERLAAEDPNPAVRRRATAGLGQLDEDPALHALNRLIDRLPGPERVFAARALARAWRARPFVLGRVRAGFAPLRPGGPDRRTPNDVLAALLPAYGTMLAEQPTGGETAADRVPLVLGLRHPDPGVRAAAAAGFDALVRRLRVLADIDRTLRILAAMDAEGFDRRVLLYERALTSLRGRPDPARSLAAAYELGRLCGDSGDFAERDWRVSATYLEALARFAAGDCRAAAAPLARAGRLLDGLLAEGLGESSPELGAKVLDWLQLRARVELFEAVRALADAQRTRSLESVPRPVLELLRNMHRLELEAQLFAIENELPVQNDLDLTLDDPLSPVTLLIETPGLAGWTIEERIAVVTLLARGIRGVAPLEMPGFEAFELTRDDDDGDGDGGGDARGRGPDRRLSDPLLDPERGALLDYCKKAYVGALQRELTRLYEVAAETDELAEERNNSRIQQLYRRILFARDQELSDMRFPSTLALRLSALLREEGARPREARELVQSMRDDLDRSGTLQTSYEGMEIAAQIDISIGASYMDEDAPRRAEIELEKAVARLEEFERAAAERGFPSSVIARIALRRSTALVSLAVNANVKLDEPDRALAYFERAYELRQDDFMKVLLACYRARSDEDAAARRILRDVPPAPDLFYNMACTYALLGESGKALGFLRRELEENHVSETSRAKQKEWAREDPDLASLRDDPRFAAITGP